MKTTIDLPDELLRELKLRALMQHRTLRDLVADHIRPGLGIAAPKAPVPPTPGTIIATGSNGLPVIPCRPDARASQLTVEELLDIEQQMQAAEDARDARRPV